ncbi:MAG: ATP12 family protein [Ascidiaceihabitans sp.]|nr:ATP12 family protein [Ascidiaceihabitans sp.]
MSDWALKRFWTEAKGVAVDGGFAVQLDGRSVKTPAKSALVVPTQALADAIAAEWDAQSEKVNPNTMPFTRSANAAIDKVATQHSEVADLLSEYGDSDLLCYRADTPVELVARQTAQWDPMLDWARTNLGVVLHPRVGIIHAPQDQGALDILRAKTHAFDAFELAAFHDLVSLSGSLILGFAATTNNFSAEQMWKISRLDDLWQEEQWGPDDEATALAEFKKSAFAHAKRFFDACQRA